VSIMTDFVWPSDMDRAENPELNRVCEYLEEVWDEHEALAAHVERLEAVFRRGFESGDEHDLDAWEVEAKIVLAEPPTTSLARLKAEWQADQAEQIREMCEGLTGSQIRSALDGLLAGLRRQAKGGVL